MQTSNVSESLLAAVLESSSTPTVIWQRLSDGSFVVAAANSSAELLLGSGASLVGIGPAGLTRWLPAIESELQICFTLGRPRTAHVSPGIDATFVPADPEYVVMRSDAGADADSGEARRFEAVGRRAAFVAHEFNNLLTVINSYTDIMLEGAVGREPDERFLREVLEAGQQAAALSAELLALTRQTSPAPVPDPDISSPTTPDETILVAEDDHALRGLLERVLRKAGYTVLSAADGAHALELLADSQADLLLTDVVMPKMSGRELTESLGERQPQMRVLYITGYGASDLAQHGMSRGANLLKKPFSARELLVEVRRVLDRP